jgi:hypothetical protein
VNTARLVFRMVDVRLSDGSMAYNVQGKVEDRILVIGCASRTHAMHVAAELNEAAWIELSSVVEGPA